MNIEQARALFGCRGYPAKKESFHEDRESAVAAQAAFHREYPGEGYGTFTRIFPLEDGWYVMLGWRADSCE